ncbi:sigma-70 family RNA polymerase sigma factor [Neolewinella aurantiaca]|uniref:Sigma-70 family RNA polymerase sigma factor n=1 Tax=Neolewinella aurantiaca TaxID=2602767 RepID=A0A5C7FG84_9BACT|nr:sigma-70 family RNA polymerase sigma factor [Neolewinella aurantiaca]TXF88619.1 sigma-70 family RNA polymerase sigma factor [Neolewinella aurantiaca]
MQAAQAKPDNELVAAIQAGKQHLLSELYKRYEKKVYYRCLGVVKDKSLAQDLAHDVFIKVFANLNKFKGTADFSFWIHAITYNHCVSYLRKAKRLRFDPIEPGVDQVDDGDEALTEKIVHDLQITQLDHLLSSLPREEELLLLMRYQDKMQIREIATILSIGESAVKMRLSRSRNRLAEMLSQIQTNEEE